MNSRRGQPWTDIDDDELRRLIADGETPGRISRRLDRYAIEFAAIALLMAIAAVAVIAGQLS